MSEIDLKYNEYYNEYIPYDKKTGETINNRRDVKYGRFEQITDLKFTKNGVKAEIKHTQCPECGYKIKYTDGHHRETVCEYCGLVLEKHPLIANQEYIIGRSTADLPENDGILRKDEKKIIAKLQGRPYHTSKREHTINKYYIFAVKISKELDMSKPELKKVKKIIYNHNIKKIHRGLDYEIVITGICVYILRNKGYTISYKTKAISSIGLTPMNYKVIKRKLDELQVLENS